VHNDNDVIVHGCDGLDQGIAVVPWIEVASVTLVTFDGDVSGNKNNQYVTRVVE
jgi:hypothetical protein